MNIALVGTTPTKPLRRALAAAGFREVGADAAFVRVYVSPSPPTRAPKSPWIWVATRGIALERRRPKRDRTTDRSIDRTTGRTELASVSRDRPDRGASDRSALDRSALDRKASDRGASDRSAPDRSAPDRSASDRSASDRSASDRNASDRSASDRNADRGSDRSASDRSAPDRSAPDRSASDRSASDRNASDRSASDRNASDRSASDRSPHASLIAEADFEVDPIDAAAAVLAGAYDALVLGPALPQLLARRYSELAIEGGAVEAPPEYVAHSAAARRVLDELDRAAHTAMAVLITGETGTGKDLAARYIHARSGRRGELVPINCAAIPNELIEGELFGYVRGAFSGAVADYDGLIQAAAGGTVFLDEVDDTPKTLQVKLLRVLEDHVIAKLGENAWREVDFRIVAATNRDLDELVQRGEFGPDLYQRLAIVRIELPPLRERAEDLPDLVAQLIARYYREDPAAPHRVVEVTAAALAALRRYSWPGNVRELRNVVFHALVRKRGGSELLLSDLPHHVVRGGNAPAGESGALFDRAALAKMIDNGRMNLRATRDQLERAALELALAKSGGSPARAARLLGEVGRGRSSDPAGTVRAMMRRHGLG